MINYIIIAVVLLVSGYFAFSPKLSKSSAWKAMVTSLASIMGSGFLISVPLLGGVVGYYAVFCMIELLVIAYGVGSVMRYNIVHCSRVSHRSC